VTHQNHFTRTWEEIMLCPKCQQQFSTDILDCPDCKIKLVDTTGLENAKSKPAISENDFLSLLERHNGKMVVPMVTTLVDWQRKIHFPKMGYGYAWVEQMQGALDDQYFINLDTVEIGRKKQWNILGFGYGYAWAKRMQGTIGDVHFTLDAMEIGTHKNWLLVGLGYGFGWTRRMTGSMTPNIHIELETTAVSREKESVFPGFGFGYAWVQTANLTFSLNNTSKG
jgi:hypothetical protein